MSETYLERIERVKGLTGYDFDSLVQAAIADTSERGESVSGVVRADAPIGYIAFEREVAVAMSCVDLPTIWGASIEYMLRQIKSLGDALSGKIFVVAYDNETQKAWARKWVGELREFGLLSVAYFSEISLSAMTSAPCQYRAYLPIDAKQIEELEQKRKLEEVDRWSDLLRVREIREAKRTPPLRTGLTSLDDALGGGLYRGVYAIGATPGLGKTALARQIADFLATQSVPTLYIALEMSPTTLVARSVARIANAKGARVSPTDVERRLYCDEDRPTVESALADYELTVAPWVYTVRTLRQTSVRDVAQVARDFVAAKGASPVVVVDYLQLLAADDKTEKRAVDDNMKSLADLAVELNTPVVAISSVNRDSYRKPISIEALKESGGIEYGADCIIGLQVARNGQEPVREGRVHIEYFNSLRGLECVPVQAIMLKSRTGTAGKVANLKFAPRRMEYQSIDRLTADRLLLEVQSSLQREHPDWWGNTEQGKTSTRTRSSYPVNH